MTCACKRHLLPSLRDGASRAVIGDLPSGWSQDEGADLRGLSGISSDYSVWSRRMWKAGDARPSFGPRRLRSCSSKIARLRVSGKCSNDGEDGF